MPNDDDTRLRALINDARRSDPLRDAALSADAQNLPKAWSAVEEADFVAKTYGAEEERIARLIAEANRRT